MTNLQQKRKPPSDATAAFVDACKEAVAECDKELLPHDVMPGKILDSGHRRTFETGAQRDRASDKPRPDLISPFFQLRLGEWLRLGAEKYDPRNWEKGMPLSEFLASLMRHVCQFVAGNNDEDHLAAVAFNVMGIMHGQEMLRRGIWPEQLDDLPDYNPRDSWPFAFVPAQAKAEADAEEDANEAALNRLVGVTGIGRIVVEPALDPNNKLTARILKLLWFLEKHRYMPTEIQLSIGGHDEIYDEIKSFFADDEAERLFSKDGWKSLFHDVETIVVDRLKPESAMAIIHFKRAAQETIKK